LQDLYEGEKVIPKEERIIPKVKERKSLVPHEQPSLKSYFLYQRERPSKSRPSLPKERE